MLGKRTAELHRAFASDDRNPHFKPEPIKAADVAGWVSGTKKLANAAYAQLTKALPNAPEAVRGAIEGLIERKDECLAAIEVLGKGPLTASKTRIHGDYHLGQVLVAKNDFYIIDFEGEPTRTLEERRAKSSPFKDVAGMLRSFEYAEWAALFAIAEHEADSVGKLLPFASSWRKVTQETFLKSYFDAIGDCPSCPKDRAEADRLLNLFTLEKALYEICYEATNRPTWLRIPITGLQTVLDGLKAGKGERPCRSVAKARRRRRAAATPIASATCMIRSRPWCTATMATRSRCSACMRTSPISSWCAATIRPPARPGCWIAPALSSPSWSSSSNRASSLVRFRAGSTIACASQLPAKTIELEDPYRFPPVLGDVDMHLLAEGTHLKIYERLGAQLIEIDGVKGVSFAVWAPNARRVSVVGDFNDWDGRRHPMRKRVEAGVWELFLPGLQRRRALQVRDQERGRTIAAAEGGPAVLQIGTAAAHRLDRAWRAQVRLDRSAVDEPRAKPPAAARRRSRSTSAISAPGRGCRRRTIAT